jgi:cobalt-zinc-cadmium efflux system protein
VALTAHLVMPYGPADDAFLREAGQTLQERFGIGHITLQSARRPLAPGCGGA